MMLTVVLDFNRYHSPLWDEYRRFMDHPFQCKEIIDHCFGSYFSAIVYVNSEWHFYDAINKIATIGEDAQAIWEDDSFWAMMCTDNSPRVRSLVDTIKSLGGNFLCTLINAEVTVNIVSAINPKYQLNIMDHQAFTQTGWSHRADSEILTFQLNVQ